MYLCMCVFLCVYSVCLPRLLIPGVYAEQIRGALLSKTETKKIPSLQPAKHMKKLNQTVGHIDSMKMYLKLQLEKIVVCGKLVVKTLK